MVGHDIKNDFTVLDISVPAEKTRDTCLYGPLREVAGLPPNSCPSLKNLAANLLGKLQNVL